MLSKVDRTFRGARASNECYLYGDVRRSVSASRNFSQGVDAVIYCFFKHIFSLLTDFVVEFCISIIIAENGAFFGWR